jgi:hypothetical protein
MVMGVGKKFLNCQKTPHRRAGVAGSVNRASTEQSAAFSFVSDLSIRLMMQTKSFESLFILVSLIVAHVSAQQIPVRQSFCPAANFWAAAHFAEFHF